MRCELPPEGWYCTRGSGHEGPCAARPVEPKALPLLKDYETVEECIQRNRADTNVALGLLAKAKERIATLETALTRIATEHQSYDDPALQGPNFSGMYGIGVVDGHRCAAKIARAALGESETSKLS